MQSPFPVPPLPRSTSKGSDREQAYASPISSHASSSSRPSSSSFPSSRTSLGSRSSLTSHSTSGRSRQGDGRQRRHRGSSDDDGQLTTDGLCNEDFRVGGPYLCSIPVDSIMYPLDHPLYPLESRGSPALHEVVNILNRHRLRPLEHIFIGRRSRFNPEATPVPTVVIVAHRQKVDNEWLGIAREIRKHLTENGLGDVCVEMADPRAFQLPNTFPVLKDDAIFDEWPCVLKRILDDINLQDILSIGCFRRGLEKKEHCKPTVLVTVNTKSRIRWKAHREKIVNILNTFSSLGGTAVEITKDEIFLGADLVRGISDEVLQHPVRGDSICPHDVTSSSGTLGGFLEIQAPNEKWFTVAVTCFYCVLPTDENIADLKIAEKSKEAFKTLIAAWRDTGVYPTDENAREHLIVDHPSQLAIGERVKKLNRRIHDTKSRASWSRANKMESEGTLEFMSRAERNIYLNDKKEISQATDLLTRIKDFQAKGRKEFGFVRAGSGFTSAYPVSSITEAENPKKLPTAMDWALVAVSSDRAAKITNSVQDSDDITTSMKRDYALQHDEDLYMRGYRSGLSTGRYSSLHAANVHGEYDKNGKLTRTKVTLEHTVCGTPEEPFGKPGDSGAFVCDGHWVLVGLHWGGALTGRWNYFTHVHDLFDNIMNVTDIKAVRVLGDIPEAD